MKADILLHTDAIGLVGSRDLVFCCCNHRLLRLILVEIIPPNSVLLPLQFFTHLKEDIMPKITFIGAGSTVFAKNLLGDILSFPELANATISLHDIDHERLETSEVVARRVAEAVGAHPAIEATTNRRAALEGADYAITMFQVAGYKPGTVIDFEIPKKYGLRQTIADTLGIGGIMRGLRTIPVMLDMCRDMEELCPDVTFLNYVNPMAMLCWAMSRATPIETVGLCHSVQGTAEQLANDIGVPKSCAL
jgi:alpha-galactosidase